jgi:hypothetical protein
MRCAETGHSHDAKNKTVARGTGTVSFQTLVFLAGFLPNQASSHSHGRPHPDSFLHAGIFPQLQDQNAALPAP